MWDKFVHWFYHPDGHFFASAHCRGDDCPRCVWSDVEMLDAIGTRAPENEDEKDNEGEMDTISEVFKNIVCTSRA
jgi:hypothetical protein